MFGFYWMTFDKIRYEIDVKPNEFSSLIIFTGIFTSAIARRKRLLSFFFGGMFSIPLLFLIGMAGGMMRGT